MSFRSYGRILFSSYRSCSLCFPYFCLLSRKVHKICLENGPFGEGIGAKKVSLFCCLVFSYFSSFWPHFAPIFWIYANSMGFSSQKLASAMAIPDPQAFFPSTRCDTLRFVLKAQLKLSLIRGTTRAPPGNCGSSHAWAMFRKPQPLQLV